MSLSSEVKAKLDIVDFMRADGLQLKHEGVDRYSCSCPFHSEKTPSFKVDSSFQRFKCFGCGATGDVIEYFAKQNTLDYKAATLLLADKLGIKVDESKKEDYSKQKRMLELAKDLEDFYKSEFAKLSEFHPAKKQITDRKLKIEGFEDYFGYAPSSNTAMIDYMTKTLSYSLNELKELGYVNEKGNVQLRDRLVFFIRNYMGLTVGFSGRSLEKSIEGWKYVNSKSSDLFDKSSALYNIDKAKKSARKENSIYLTEGQFDVIAMIQNGIENTVAISGTAFTEKHISVLNKCVDDTGKIILCLDGDSAGLKAAVRVFQSFPDIQNRLYMITIPNKMDPCDFFEKSSNKELPKPIKMIDLMFNQLKKKYPPTILENRTKLVDEVQDKITQYITDKTLREVYLRAACSITGVSYTSLNQKAKKVYKSTQEEVKEDSTRLSKEDSLYIVALAVYLKNRDLLTKKIEIKHYPPKFRKYVKQLEEYNGTRLIPESLEDSKLTQEIVKQDVKRLEDSDLAQMYYDTMLNTAHKETKRIKLNNEKLNIISSLEGLDKDSFIKTLERIEEGEGIG